MISNSSVFDIGDDFFDHFSRAIGCISVTASHKSSDVCLEFITESKLDVVTQVAKLDWITSTAWHK
jgi:hypothetical protein